MEMNDPKYHSMENIELVHGGSGVTFDPRPIPLTNEEIDKAFEEAFAGKKVNPGYMVSAEELHKVLDKKDNINPDHYKSSTSLECIEAMEMVFGKEAVIDFCVCNAWKYIWRWKHKNGQEDLNKAKWYVDKAASMRYTKDKYSEILTRMYQYIEGNSSSNDKE